MESDNNQKPIKYMKPQLYQHQIQLELPMTSRSFILLASQEFRRNYEIKKEKGKKWREKHLPLMLTAMPLPNLLIY